MSIISRYIKYRLRSKSKFGVHSPFVYELITDVFPTPNGTTYFDWDAIEKSRTQLLESREKIKVTDYGAGSKVFKGDQRPVSGIAKHALQSPEQAQLLFKLVNHFQPKTVIELGTSLGITTLYLAKANTKAQVFTLEGCPETLAIAQKLFDEHEATHIQPLEGPFKQTLPKVLDQIEQLDFAYIDGHHSEQPTIDYFEQCLEKSHANTVIVCDDIHWSNGMERAWEHIKAHPKVTVSIDLFHIGIVFFRTQQAPEHFTLRY